MNIPSKIGINEHDEDLSIVYTEALEKTYQDLISDQQVRNAVLAVLIKLELHRRESEKENDNADG